MLGLGLQGMKAWMRRRGRGWWLLLLLLLPAGCDESTAQDAGAPAPPKVTVSEPLHRRITEYDEYTGRFAAVATVEVRARVSGALEQVNFIYPEDEGLHRKLGTLLLAQNDNAGAVREYQAVLAMNPLDKAQAEFDVARAYMAAGDKGKAEESVLASLEAAPGFKPAQKLLLEIEGK